MIRDHTTHDGMSCLVVGSHLFLAFSHDHGLALGAHHDLVLGVLEVAVRDHAPVLARRHQGLLAQSGTVLQPHVETTELAKALHGGQVDEEHLRVLDADALDGDAARIGANSVVVAGVTIGERCQIGAGSVVTKNIPSYSVAVGNPARVIKRYDAARAKWIRVDE